MRRALIGLSVAAYLAGASLTFGYGVNRHCGVWYETETRNGIDCIVRKQPPGCSHADGAAAFFFLAWPAYWFFRGGIELTKPAPTPSDKEQTE